MHGPLRHSPTPARPRTQSLLRCRWDPGTRYCLAALLRIAHGVAAALQHMHAQGIAHGDVYAHNVLADAAGDPVLVDYGLSFCCCFWGCGDGKEVGQGGYEEKVPRARKKAALPSCLWWTLFLWDAVPGIPMGFWDLARSLLPMLNSSPPPPLPLQARPFGTTARGTGTLRRRRCRPMACSWRACCSSWTSASKVAAGVRALAVGRPRRIGRRLACAVCHVPGCHVSPLPWPPPALWNPPPLNNGTQAWRRR